MNQTAVINIKTEPQVKISARKLANNLGLSLSGLINAYLKQVIRTKTVTFSTSDEEPTEYLVQMLKESCKDIKAGRISPSFSDVKGAFKWLNNPHRKYAR